MLLLNGTRSFSAPSRPSPQQQRQQQHAPFTSTPSKSRGLRPTTHTSVSPSASSTSSHSSSGSSNKSLTVRSPSSSSGKVFSLNVRPSLRRPSLSKLKRISSAASLRSTTKSSSSYIAEASAAVPRAKRDAEEHVAKPAPDKREQPFLGEVSFGVEMEGFLSSLDEALNSVQVEIQSGLLALPSSSHQRIVPTTPFSTLRQVPQALQQQPQGSPPSSSSADSSLILPPFKSYCCSQPCCASARALLSTLLSSSLSYSSPRLTPPVVPSDATEAKDRQQQQQQPAVLVSLSPSKGSWTEEREATLQRTLRELELLRSSSSPAASTASPSSSATATLDDEDDTSPRRRSSIDRFYTCTSTPAPAFQLSTTFSHHTPAAADLGDSISYLSIHELEEETSAGAITVHLGDSPSPFEIGSNPFGTMELLEKRGSMRGGRAGEMLRAMIADKDGEGGIRPLMGGDDGESQQDREDNEMREETDEGESSSLSLLDRHAADSLTHLFCSGATAAIRRPSSLKISASENVLYSPSPLRFASSLSTSDISTATSIFVDVKADSTLDTIPAEETSFSSSTTSSPSSTATFVLRPIALPASILPLGLRYVNSSTPSSLSRSFPSAQLDPFTAVASSSLAYGTPLSRPASPVPSSSSSASPTSSRSSSPDPLLLTSFADFSPCPSSPSNSIIATPTPRYPACLTRGRSRGRGDRFRRSPAPSPSPQRRAVSDPLPNRTVVSSEHGEIFENLSSSAPASPTRVRGRASDVHDNDNEDEPIQYDFDVPPSLAQTIAHLARLSLSVPSTPMASTSFSTGQGATRPLASFQTPLSVPIVEHKFHARPRKEPSFTLLPPIEGSPSSVANTESEEKENGGNVDERDGKEEGMMKQEGVDAERAVRIEDDEEDHDQRQPQSRPNSWIDVGEDVYPPPSSSSIAYHFSSEPAPSPEPIFYQPLHTAAYIHSLNRANSLPSISLSSPSTSSSPNYSRPFARRPLPPIPQLSRPPQSFTLLRSTTSSARSSSMYSFTTPSAFAPFLAAFSSSSTTLAGTPPPKYTISRPRPLSVGGVDARVLLGLRELPTPPMTSQGQGAFTPWSAGGDWPREKSSAGVGRQRGEDAEERQDERGGSYAGAESQLSRVVEELEMSGRLDMGPGDGMFRFLLFPCCLHGPTSADSCQSHSFRFTATNRAPASWSARPSSKKTNEERGSLRSGPSFSPLLSLLSLLTPSLLASFCLTSIALLFPYPQSFDDPSPPPPHRPTNPPRDDTSPSPASSAPPPLPAPQHLPPLEWFQALPPGEPTRSSLVGSVARLSHTNPLWIPARSVSVQPLLRYPFCSAIHHLFSHFAWVTSPSVLLFILLFWVTSSACSSFYTTPFSLASASPFCSASSISIHKRLSALSIVLYFSMPCLLL
jgi:hypothetical protein